MKTFKMKLIVLILVGAVFFQSSLCASFRTGINPCAFDCCPSGQSPDCNDCNDDCDDPCDPCEPCAPFCGWYCGISYVTFGLGIAAVAAVAAIILASGSSTVEHSH